MVKLIDSIPEIDAESTAGKTFDEEDVQGQIRFEYVHFRYPTRPGVRVLQGLSFKVEPGTYVALVGASGCGKSTVYVPSKSLLKNSDYSCSIQLIERFYDPLSGQVLLDGKPINEFNIQEYRKQIALVSQEPVSTTYRYVFLRDLKEAVPPRLCMLAPSVSTSYLAQPSPNPRSRKKNLKRPAVMQTSWISSSHCLSKSTHINLTLLSISLQWL